jgi:hypothetical protein
LSSKSSDSHLPPEIKPIQQVHDVSTKQQYNKYNVPHAHHLQQQGIALFPFTINHQGGLGFQATNFLFGHHSIFLPVHSEPSWTTQNFCTNPPAIDLYHYSKTHIPPQAILLPKATKNWNQRSFQSTTCFGRTYHTYTPESWATQALALNLTKALIHHLLTHMRRIQTFEAHQRKIQYTNNFHSLNYRHMWCFAGVMSRMRLSLVGEDASTEIQDRRQCRVRSQL